jgi:TrfA protein
MTQVQLSLELVEQSRAVAAAADAASGLQQDVLAAGSRTLALAARRVDARAKASEDAILELESTATNAVLTAARARRAVRRGKDVYLPSWSDFAVGLPNALLRSSLWTAGEHSDEWMENFPIANLGRDVSVLYTGRQLTQYDRRVFASCLDYYRTDRPLSPGGAAAWVLVSFYELALSMGLTYTLNTHKAMRGSLLRLEAAALRVCAGHLELPVPRLLEVAFDDGYYSRPETELKGRDQIAFRVLEQFAALYGPTTWTAVPKPALGMKGLRGWLMGFYATHSVARQLPFKTLHDLSGLGCRPNDFRARLCKALDELMVPETPMETKVEGYAVSVDRKSITVRMARWTAGAGNLRLC